MPKGTALVCLVGATLTLLLWAQQYSNTDPATSTVRVPVKGCRTVVLNASHKDQVGFVTLHCISQPSSWQLNFSTLIHGHRHGWQQHSATTPIPNSELDLHPGGALGVVLALHKHTSVPA